MSDASDVHSIWIQRTPQGYESSRGVLYRWSSRLRLLFFLSAHEFRLRYRAQALGAFWSILHPFVMMVVLTVVLSRKLGTGRDYPVHLLIGLILWAFVTSSTQAAVGSLVAKSEIVRRAMVPRELLPLAAMLSYSVNLALESIVLIVVVPFFPDAFRLSPTLVLVPFVLALLVALLAGVACLAAALNVVYRDVAYVVTTFLLILFWLTPVVYSPGDVAEPYRSVLSFNPIAAAMQAIRDIVMRGEGPSMKTWSILVGSAAISIVMGRFSFRRLERLVLDCV